MGLSAIFGFGKFTCGEFHLKAPPNFVPQCFDISGKLLLFDGHLQHKSCPFEGTRLSVVAFQHPLRVSASPGMKGQLKQLGFTLDDFEAWLPSVRVALDKESVSKGECVYIGGLNQRLGLKASPWAPLWAKGPGVNWGQAAEILKRRVAEDPTLLSLLLDLEGRRIACTCPLAARCYADVLIAAFLEQRELRISVSNSPPPSDEAARSAAQQQREGWKQTRQKADMMDRQSPTQCHGTGPPITVGHAERRRLLADGGGLWSPGLWPPERRYAPTGVAEQFHKALGHELSKFGRSKTAGLRGVLDDLWASRVK